MPRVGSNMCESTQEPFSFWETRLRGWCRVHVVRWSLHLLRAFCNLRLSDYFNAKLGVVPCFFLFAGGLPNLKFVLLLPYRERYVNIILKMEEMLKNWFPHIKPQRHNQADTTELMEETTLSKKPKVWSIFFVMIMFKLKRVEKAEPKYA